MIFWLFFVYIYRKKHILSSLIQMFNIKCIHTLGLVINNSELECHVNGKTPKRSNRAAYGTVDAGDGFHS